MHVGIGGEVIVAVAMPCLNIFHGVAMDQILSEKMLALPGTVIDAVK